MLLVLYMEYIERCGGERRYSYLAWLELLRGYAEEMGATFDEMVREEIDPTWTGS